MTLALIASAALVLSANAAVPPPAEGDDRTAILATVNALFDRLGTANGEEFREVIAPEGMIFIHNRMEPDAPKLLIRSNAIMTDREGPDEHMLTERMGIPTVLQHGDMAHVWAPYAFWIDGEKSHCGIDSISLSRSEGVWRVTNMTYSVEPVAQCAALGAPENPE
ncbi:nuclear transport factor 2 family protein [Croceicoccus sp. Ery5]|jgi:hypothetical protein|uniref:nuclear transport factor 2 family protein n=1 Tax=Croceicoccus sp. Ery5 TaxID=1703340 RepID=UPI001E2F1BAD|nr:nuclear transport factor 2 family protein [Croceicoccus sp. Ery5]